jgi:hypothetical protein
MRARRLLVKARPIEGNVAFALGKQQVTLRPLLTPKPEGPMGAAAPARWHVTEQVTGDDAASLWEQCHQLRTGGFGIAGAPAVEFAEPDFEQQWPVDSTGRNAARAFAAGAGALCQAPTPPNGDFPLPSSFDWRWYQDDAHSGLGTARDEASKFADRVTIAHLDTGYRQGHSVLPRLLDTGRQRNFVDDGRGTNDATDPGVEGFVANPGHGTGTIGILAGGVFDGTAFQAAKGDVGGAPFATIIPIRVANSVVLFTNSSIAQGIAWAIENNVDVLSMSMGGVPSQIWADMVNTAYDRGVTMVTAAGNNFGPGKARVPRFIVYPARFGRVLAACGVMANGAPYADFADARKMAGSYGPDSKMDTAIAAYTPNTPWAEYACPSLIRFDGCGTSSATPQIAAAAACWLQKNRAAMQKLSGDDRWMRVEAVRQALFAAADPKDREHFGRGLIRAQEAMKLAPLSTAELQKLRQKEDGVSVPILGPILKVIFGAAAPASQQMLQVEAAQVLARSGEMENLLADAGIDPDRPPDDIPEGLRRQLLEGLAEHPTASNTLRVALGGAVTRARPVVAAPAAATGPSPAETPVFPKPSVRRLRVFAFDPVLGLRIDTEDINEATLEVPWEENLQPGPVGEYVEVVDIDPPSNAAYAPVDLNHPHLLASDGLDPSEGVPQFHQQMVYAVAMTTIGVFEQALGRRALWAEHRPTNTRRAYVQRLRIYPHALREQNAYYSPDKKALLFGYFNANRTNAGDNLPGGVVFSCLSHDVVAHETTHALLDGLHPAYQHITNPDIAAFHEAFADIVAIFQHFSIPAALKHTIARSRGDLKKNNLLAQLAQQFGQASNGSRALRSALAQPAKPTDYAEALEVGEPHGLGAVLLSAVFQSFLEIYDARVADLKRLATSGTGVLPRGDIPVDLVNRMASEAACAADHVLKTCIRALDYCPPVDLTFGEYLRALITADMDLEPEDRFNYRTAFISGFRARGIFPQGVRNLSEATLRWGAPVFRMPTEMLRAMLQGLDTSWNLSCDRREAYLRSERNARLLWRALQDLDEEALKVAEEDLGVFVRPGPHVPEGISCDKKTHRPKLQIHSVRPARRINSRGQQLMDLVVEATQRYEVPNQSGEITTYRGGFTLLIDVENARIRYVVRKRVDNIQRMRAEDEFRSNAFAAQSYFEGDDREPFAMMHRGM